jgi:hypothetical protein
MSKHTNEELLALHWAGKPCPKSDDARLRNLIRAHYANELVAKIDAARVRDALKPFADYAEYIATERPGWDHDEFYFSEQPYQMPKMEAFRRAREVLLRKQDVCPQCKGMGWIDCLPAETCTLCNGKKFI